MAGEVGTGSTNAAGGAGDSGNAHPDAATRDQTAAPAPAPAPEPGQELDLEPTGIAHGGISVARHEGRVIFIADAIPGEPVRARITESKSSFSRAVALAPLEPSEHRIPHVWREAGIERDPDDRAGGAEFGHIRLSHQRELKATVLSESLQRFGGFTWEGTVKPLNGDDLAGGAGWRTRVTLHVDDEGRVGPYAARSHRVIQVSSLPLAFPDIDELAPLDGEIPSLGQLGTGPGQVRGPGRIDFVAPAELDTRMRVRLEHGPSPRPASVITERVHDIDFAVDEDGFWQVHRLAATALADTVLELAGERLDPEGQHLDLYGGVGLFAAMFANAGARYVETVESAAGATQHAVTNLARWRGPSAVTARVDRYLRQLDGELAQADRADLSAGTILLDPPRAGAGKEVVEAIAALRPAQIIYVACDPVALARDTATLRASAYELDELRALDLFPNTHHIECVARFLPVGRS